MTGPLEILFESLSKIQKVKAMTTIIKKPRRLLRVNGNAKESRVRGNRMERIKV